MGNGRTWVLIFQRDLLASRAMLQVRVSVCVCVCVFYDGLLIAGKSAFGLPVSHKLVG